MFDAWKQRQRQRLENRPERTVFYNIFATMMLVLAVELLMAVASILAINVTEQLDENAKDLLTMRVRNRASYVQEILRNAEDLEQLFLNAGQQPVRVTGRSWTEKIIETDSRWGAVHNGALVEKTLQQHTLEFAGGGTAFLDFNGVQYHSYLRSTHTSVQGERGEVFDDTLRCLDAAGEPVCRQLTPLPDPLAAAAAQAGLNEDETAIACFLDRMQGYLAGGAEVYPLADALQDAYLALLMERALAVPGQSVESTPQPWNTEEG